MADVTGGIFALAGVVLGGWLTWLLSRSEMKARRTDAKADRLRAAYLEVVTAAERVRSRAFELMELSDKVGESWLGPDVLQEKLLTSEELPSHARVVLLLESDDADRAALTALDNADRRNTAFTLALVQLMVERRKNPEAPADDLFSRMSELEEAVREVVKLARVRLAELEQEGA